MLDSFALMAPKIRAAGVAAKLGLPRGNYGVVMLHRPSNVDDKAQLGQIVDNLLSIAQRVSLVFPVHPRTRQRLKDFGLAARLEAVPAVKLTEPLSYIEFMSLVVDCRSALTDSDGVPEETRHLGIPLLTLRENTERPVAYWPRRSARNVRSAVGWAHGRAGGGEPAAAIDPPAAASKSQAGGARLVRVLDSPASGSEQHSPLMVSTQPLVPVVLSGGSGSRLWPLSRELRPKQFLPLVGERTLFQDTIARTRVLGDLVRPAVVVCNEAHRFLVAEQLRAGGPRAEAIVLEPVGRNTAPAAGVAALIALAAETKRSSGATDPLLLVLPADHLILDQAAFAAAVHAALPSAAEGYLVTFGVVPDRPETGYGYILAGRKMGACSVLEKFVEKPDLATAKGYVESTRYLWNSGMFLFSASAFLRELGTHAPAMLRACERAVAEAVVDADFVRLGAAFVDCPANSIDYAVMEKTARAAVVPLAAGWSDVGSWPALHDVLQKDANGNVTTGDVLLESCSNSYAVARSRLVALVGITDTVVVETRDSVLVMARDHAQDVKRIVDALKRAGRPEVVDDDRP